MAHPSMWTFPPSKVVIIRLKLDKDHKKILEQKAKSPQVGKGESSGRNHREDLGIECLIYDFH